MTPADKQAFPINITGGIVALLVVGLLWFISWCLVFYNIPSENATNLSQIIGMIGTQVGLVVGWFFGSSSSAKKQTDTIATLASTAANAQAALQPLPDKIVTVAGGESVRVDGEPKQ